MTRSGMQRLLGRRIGPWAGLADFDDAASYALRFRGVAVADDAAVSDADLAPVLAADENAVLDVAEWRMLESILNNLSDAELFKIGVAEDPDKVAQRLKQRLDRLYARLRDQYNLGVPTLQIGIVSLGGSQNDDETSINY